jgi:tetratricopeptide (TPR) repeat protein
MPRVFLFIAAAAAVLAASPAQDRARDLYQRTEYQQSLDILLHLAVKDTATLRLMGQDYFMLGEYKKATDTLEKAKASEPDNPETLLWLGRAYGRRAETANVFTAAGYASKARQNLEKSVSLDPSNREATGDLLDFYLEAPGFMGGGFGKAETLAETIGKSDPAEGHYARAVIDERRKDFSGAEQQLRRALALAPRDASRFVSLAKYLGEHGQLKESDALFKQAALIAPNDPRVAFDRAQTYVEQKRNLAEARDLLEKYLRSPLTPNDPPRERAEELLSQVSGIG